MDINVLGPLAVELDGRSIVPSAGKPRQVLTLLALRVGHTVGTPVLMEEVWGERAPRSAATTLQTYILHLRRSIAAVGSANRRARDLLATCFGGYRLSNEGVRCDVHEFVERARNGAAALESGDARTASATLGSALSLWRGPALSDVPVGDVLGLELMGLEERRMRVLELRVDADLMLGRPAELLPELRMLTAQQPFHEGWAARFILALYRSGHVGRALEEFQTHRRAVVDELGLEPTPRLRRLHTAILAGDPELERAELTLDAYCAAGPVRV
jgi:DNA-binding SARP family transcriptional activator